jgi:Cdc6-like AAA superfamily ATPase
VTKSLIHPDSELLTTFEQKLQVIRDRVRGVAEGYQTAAYLTGRPGTSKTYTVREELERITAPSVIRNARMTPMGLFEFLREHPEHIVVLDDIATLFKDRAALQILMAALDGDPMKPRRVTYKSKDKDLEFHFSGGIVGISNLSLGNDPLADAVSSRVVLLEHEPTDEELAAFMRKLAHNGYKDLTAEQCQEVVTFVVNETRMCDRRLDLRHLTKAYEDRRQWEDGLSQTPWEELVRTSLKKWLTPEIPSKAEEIDQQRILVEEAMARFPSDVTEQIRYTGMKKSTFYKRKREVNQVR